MYDIEVKEIELKYNMKVNNMSNYYITSLIIGGNTVICNIK